ncbi:hypothetical protein SARC_07444 [Sphaeroforma arctica JP610]|uniref:Fatty acid hydroxylase domain-containing protein n=1 Tax=Sphaeroforma arctica JP610 TaxID=667725 RepID=A0A0L0FTQ3_9EUKA|nr:hypothetical protein SARC_07444 [Sphaeroforma arctica JP610]KNC80182.1 hypothetical protein SARC_07444 [Sphaeroforma arctica JP610]|eukprot:XP_014154084.1 hypothetical protein SARC_07444 [Sphaeroforma arctica JP610]
MGRFHLSTYIQVNALIAGVGVATYLLAHDTIQRVKHNTDSADLVVHNHTLIGAFSHVRIWDMFVLHAGVVIRNAVILAALTFLTRHKPVIVPPQRKGSAKNTDDVHSEKNKLESIPTENMHASGIARELLAADEGWEARKACVVCDSEVRAQVCDTMKLAMNGASSANNRIQHTLGSKSRSIHNEEHTSNATDISYSSARVCGKERKCELSSSTQQSDSGLTQEQYSLKDESGVEGSKGMPLKTIDTKIGLGVKETEPSSYFSGENREMILRMVFIAGVSEIFSLMYQLPRTTDVALPTVDVLKEGWQGMATNCMAMANSTLAYNISTVQDLNHTTVNFVADVGRMYTEPHTGIDSVYLLLSYGCLFIGGWVAFTFKMLWFELIFDLCHYWAHRVFHSHKWLYRNFHKLHHRHLHPSPLTTYMQGCGDVLLSNTLPFCVALSVSPVFSELELYVLLSYKTFVEVAGHTGKVSRASSFPAMPPLVNVLGIDLHTEDHDLHHTHFNYNYSKRFVLWDKLFGTYYYIDSSEKG